MKLTSLAIALTIALGSSQAAFAADDKKDKAKKKEQTIAQMIEKKTATIGLFDFYQDKKTGETLMLLDESQLDTPFLHFAQTVDGLANAGHFRGSYRRSQVIDFRRHIKSNNIDTTTPM